MLFLQKDTKHAETLNNESQAKEKCRAVSLLSSVGTNAANQLTPSLLFLVFCLTIS